MLDTNNVRHLLR